MLVPDQEVMTVREVSEYLGLSESKVRRLVKSNGIPFVKLGGCYRFYLPKVREWLSASTTAAEAVTNEQLALQRSTAIWKDVVGE